jgi:hypothetical protein
MLGFGLNWLAYLELLVDLLNDWIPELPAVRENKKSSRPRGDFYFLPVKFGKHIASFGL